MVQNYCKAKWSNLYSYCYSKDKDLQNYQRISNLIQFSRSNIIELDYMNSRYAGQVSTPCNPHTAPGHSARNNTLWNQLNSRF